MTPSNIHDSVAFDDVYHKVTEQFSEIEIIVADSAYKAPTYLQKVFDDSRVLSTAYKRPQTMKGGHKWYEYVYDEHYDCIICPEYQPLPYSTTNRDGYCEHKSDPRICVNCPTRHLCTRSKEACKNSGQQVSKWCEEHGISVSTHYSQQRKVNGSANKICFAEISIGMTNPNPATSIQCGELYVKDYLLVMLPYTSIS